MIDSTLVQLGWVALMLALGEGLLEVRDRKLGLYLDAFSTCVIGAFVLLFVQSGRSGRAAGPGTSGRSGSGQVLLISDASLGRATLIHPVNTICIGEAKVA